ncbi:MAG TPA: histidine kinase [Bryobacteraceae bacterium]|jgi:two-component system sensor histidine kinase KdpD
MTGHLKVFLGYAAGVGKTYQMLDEAQQLSRRGVDVVIGYFEPHARKDTIAKTEGLETIPRKKVEYRGAMFEEMDSAAILARHPQVCVVDEFPHTNVPGSDRVKRWEDVLALLDAGIDVLTTMNIQHLESLNDQVYGFTGVQVRETIPDWVMKQASEIVMVDLTPRALLNRLDRGVVYAPDKAEAAARNFFKESTLAALRELALRQTAHEVEVRNDDPLVAKERILIHVTSAPSTAALIRRGRRVADYLQSECFAVVVRNNNDDREAIERHLNFARNLHIETRVLEGEDEAATLVDFARRNGIVQLLIGRPPKTFAPLAIARRHQLVLRIIGLAHDMQVTVVAERREPASS